MCPTTWLRSSSLGIADGRYTGGVDFYAYGQAKADHVGVSVTDLPLLEAVGHPHVVNPDRGLRKVAKLRGWPELAFSQTAG